MRVTQGGYYAYALMIKNLIEMHGHDCEELSHAACYCTVAFLASYFRTSSSTAASFRGYQGKPYAIHV